MKNIAVEKGLSTVKDFLKDSGYKVYEVDSRQIDNKDFVDGFDAIVITGIEENKLGIQHTLTGSPIIEAKGLTPEEVKNRIDQRVQH